MPDILIAQWHQAPSLFQSSGDCERATRAVTDWHSYQVLAIPCHLHFQSVGISPLQLPPQLESMDRTYSYICIYRCICKDSCKTCKCRSPKLHQHMAVKYAWQVPIGRMKVYSVSAPFSPQRRRTDSLLPAQVSHPTAANRKLATSTSFTLWSGDSHHTLGQSLARSSGQLRLTM